MLAQRPVSSNMKQHCRRYSAGLLLTTAAGSIFPLVHKLVSDPASIADHQDPNLLNPWGQAFGATPIWVENSGTGTAMLYDGTGLAIPLKVPISQTEKADTANSVNPFASNCKRL
jgi:hypothetical protein